MMIICITTENTVNVNDDIVVAMVIISISDKAVVDKVLSNPTRCPVTPSQVPQPTRQLENLTV